MFLFFRLTISVLGFWFGQKQILLKQKAAATRLLSLYILVVLYITITVKSVPQVVIRIRKPHPHHRPVHRRSGHLQLIRHTHVEIRQKKLPLFEIVHLSV